MTRTRIVRVLDLLQQFLSWVVLPVALIQVGGAVLDNTPSLVLQVAVGSAGFVCWLLLLALGRRRRATQAATAAARLAALKSGENPTPLLDIDKYGQFTVDMWISSSREGLDERQLAIMAHGLAGETGEVMEVLKKRLRDGNFNEQHLKKELGDVAYYWARLCRAYGFQPSEVLGENVHKLLDRKERGVMRGSGDDR